MEVVAEEAKSVEGEAIEALPEAAGRRRVLDAAAALFVAQGYYATTLRQIASTAGIKAGSIYHHFDSKESLFVAVLDDGIDAMIDAFESVGMAEPGDERVVALQRYVRAHLGAVFEHGPYTTAHVTAFFTAPDTVRTRAVDRRDEYEQRWQLLLEAHFPALDPARCRLHRLVLFGAMNATVEWFDASGSVSLDELATMITRQFLFGVEV